MAALVAAASAAVAGAPETSMRPVARPDTAQTPTAVQTPTAIQQTVSEPAQMTRPVSRPAGLPRREESPVKMQDRPVAERFSPSGRDRLGDRPERIQTPAPKTIKQERGGILASLRPLLRPLGVRREAAKRKEMRARGAVCGDPAIQGEAIGRVPGRIKGCGVDGAVKVRSINGVSLSQHAVMDCRTAGAIKSWIAKGMKPAVGGYGGGVAQLRVAAHYACRSRNNQKGAKISEHGKGHAIDIAGFQLRDGRTITVLSDWGGGQKGRILDQMHRSACGPFGTVLGPNSDKFHQDHFHFDTARYRSGSYCR
ncbi:extensin family protein [Roseovarius sp. Pro17]|uniref:extensin-like domain-containing protein n=1 Tax=Roseovarius sp. Pro17 TaxID=3108175 RepID=UPI002D781295|nr:extensin family protein [Roseovarius sp. Pro17]